MNQVTPFSALYIDMQYSYLFNTLWAYLRPIQQEDYIRQIESVWINDNNQQKLILTLCVRASTDLLLQALDWAPGSEMILTGINIPDMMQVVRLHGIIPIPVDVDKDTLGCSLAQFKAVRTPRTKGIMLSYIFGAKFDASEIIKWAHDEGLFIIEDEAESFKSPSAPQNPLVDFSTYSFGSIKTCSAFGGSINIIRNNEVIYRKMKAIQDTYPKWSQKNYFKRTLKNLIPMLLLNNQTINQKFRWACINMFPNFDYKEFVVGSIRGFQKNDQDILSTYRFRIPDPMLVMLALRMATFDTQLYQNAINRQLVGQSILQKGGLTVPGNLVKDRNFWLYPVIVPNPQLTYKILNSRGIDAYMGVTQLDIVETPIGSRHKYPSQTLDYFKNILYLPIHQNADAKSIQRICQEVVLVVNMLKRQSPKL